MRIALIFQSERSDNIMLRNVNSIVIRRPAIVKILLKKKGKMKCSDTKEFSPPPLLNPNSVQIFTALKCLTTLASIEHKRFLHPQRHQEMCQPERLRRAYHLSVLNDSQQFYSPFIVTQQTITTQDTSFSIIPFLLSSNKTAISFQKLY